MEAAKKNLTPGTVMYTRGMDMACRPCVAKVTFLGMLETPTATWFDCTVQSGRVRSYSNASKLYATRQEVLDQMTPDKKKWKA